MHYQKTELLLFTLIDALSKYEIKAKKCFQTTSLLAFLQNDYFLSMNHVFGSHDWFIKQALPYNNIELHMIIQLLKVDTHDHLTDLTQSYSYESRQKKFTPFIWL